MHLATAALLNRPATLLAASDATIRITDTGHVFLDVPGASPRIVASRHDRTEVVLRMLGDLRGERGADVVDAIRARDVRAERRAWRQIGA